MAYKFNRGMGAVICDACKAIIDAHLTHNEYVVCYENNGYDGEYCWKCINGVKKEDDKKIKELLNDL